LKTGLINKINHSKLLLNSKRNKLPLLQLNLNNNSNLNNSRHNPFNRLLLNNQPIAGMLLDNMSTNAETLST
jgi:hypothetical protein